MRATFLSLILILQMITPEVMAEELESTVILADSIENIVRLANPAFNGIDPPVIDFSVLQGFKRRKSDSLRDQFLIDSHLQPDQAEAIGDIIKVRQPNAPKYLEFEGTGTRGGGSGIAFLNDDGYVLRVEALEVYRSLQREKYPAFFVPDENLISTELDDNDEIWSEEIIDKVLTTIEFTFPLLFNSINLARKDFNFNTWIDAGQRLPLIDDYIGTETHSNNERQVQVAYRIHHKFIYDKFMYDKMNGFSRAAIKLHEYIYALANSQQSVITQRLVSLLLSPQIHSEIETIKKYRNKEISEEELNQTKIIHLLIALGFSQLSSEDAKLPEGVTVEEFTPGDRDLCGPIFNIERNNKKNDLGIFISVDMNNPHVDILNFLPSSPTKIIGYNPKKIAEVRISKPENQAKFFAALLYSKGQLRREFPLYKFPSSANHSTIVCVSQCSGKVLSMETALFYDPKLNQQDLDYAQAEADYIEKNRHASIAWDTMVHSDTTDDKELLSLISGYLKVARIASGAKLDVIYKKPYETASLLNLILSQYGANASTEMLGRVQVKLDYKKGFFSPSCTSFEEQERNSRQSH